MNPRRTVFPLNPNLLPFFALHKAIAASCVASAKAVFNHLGVAFGKDWNADGTDNLVCESRHQHHSGLVFANASLAHIKQRTLVQLAHSGAVAALYIIGVNLELRLGVHPRRRRYADVFVRLLGVGFLRVGAHKNVAAEHANRFVVEHVFVEFVAGAVGHGVVNVGEVIDVLVPRWQRQTIDAGLGVLARAGPPSAPQRCCAQSRREASVCWQ